ncbi:inositol monophosphatase family protein [Streptomyces sp. NPDC004008]
MTESADTAPAHHLADLADAVARRRLAAPDLAVHTKNDGSPVTDADQEIEDLLRSEIRRHRPGDAFVGEESGTRARAVAAGSSTAPTAPRVTSRGSRSGAP